MSDPKFLDLIMHTASEFESADAFSDWMPDNGDYVVLLTKVAKGAFQTDGAQQWYVRLTGKILAEGNPELDQREFTVGYYTGRAPGVFKSAVAVLAGRVVNNIREAVDIVDASVGAVVSVNVSTNAKGYKNTRITKLIQPAA